MKLVGRVSNRHYMPIRYIFYNIYILLLYYHTTRYIINILYSKSISPCTTNQRNSEAICTRRTLWFLFKTESVIWISGYLTGNVTRMCTLAVPPDYKI